VAARTSGLLKKISDREFKTLIALALYMDKNGNCYPSQDQIARDLGISRETANRRIQSLLRFRFDGKPIIKAVRLRNKEGTWENVRYTILPVAQVKIFEKSAENKSSL
jgi:DNA-binding GntR family transcriptional regulator